MAKKHLIQGPDGVKHIIEAPDDASPDQIMAFAEQQFGGQSSAPVETPVIDPVTAKAQTEVAQYRREHPYKTAAVDTVRRLARGTGVGSWLDEGNALISSVLPEALGGRSYEEEIAMQRAMDKQADDESTVVGSLPVIGDVTVGGLTKLAGGIASAPMTPMLRVTQGATLPARMGNMAATGAAYGAAYGAGEGEGTERIGNALAGGALGAGVGAIAPPIGAAAGNAVRAVGNRLQPLPNAISNYSRAAVNRMTNVMGMDGMTPQTFAQQSARLGPEGMIADMGENATIATEALAQQPGPQRNIIVEALDERARLAPARINNAVNQSMGPAANIPQTVQHLQQTYGAQAAPLYDAFYQTPIPMTPQLAALYQRAAASGAMRNAQRLMQIDGFDPQALAQDNLTGREWDYIKRGIDDLASQADRQGSREGLRRFGTLSQAIRQQVDATISPNDPAQSIWAQARQIAGDGIGAREAIEEGRTAFNRGLTADQLQADNAGRSALERDAFNVGAREQLRSTMSTSATNFGPNGDAATRRVLNSDESRAKLRTMLPGPDAQRITGRVDAENAMAETRGQVMGNSATARRQAARDLIPRQGDETNYAQIGSRSISGVVMEGAARIANILSNSAISERNGRISRDMAAMLVAEGAPRDQIAAALFAVARRQGVTAAARQRIENLATLVIRGSIAPATQAATAQ